MNILFNVNLVLLFLPCRESEGTFQYGNFWREADDIRSVIEHFSGANRVIGGILGHSKGALFNLQIITLLHIRVKFNSDMEFWRYIAKFLH